MVEGMRERERKRSSLTQKLSESMAAARKISFAAEIGRQTKCLLNFFFFGRAVKPISEAAKAELPPKRSPEKQN